MTPSKLKNLITENTYNGVNGSNNIALGKLPVKKTNEKWIIQDDSA